MDAIYVELFDSQEDVERNFRVNLKDNEQILFAHYADGDYSGSAWVIFYDSELDKLYEVHGSHCSCNGLEDQWDPEETTKEEILARINRGGQSSYDTTSAKKALEEWDNNITIIDDFDFDSLPTPKQIKNSINIKKLIENKEILLDEENTVKKLRNGIVSSIKEGAHNKSSEVYYSQNIELTKIAQKLLTKPKYASEIEQVITKIFEPTLNVLRAKQWEFILNVDKNKVGMKIKLPFEPELKKKSGYIKTI